MKLSEDPPEHPVLSDGRVESNPIPSIRPFRIGACTVIGPLDRKSYLSRFAEAVNSGRTALPGAYDATARLRAAGAPLRSDHRRQGMSKTVAGPHAFFALLFIVMGTERASDHAPA